MDEVRFEGLSQTNALMMDKPATTSVYILGYEFALSDARR